MSVTSRSTSSIVTEPTAKSHRSSSLKAALPNPPLTNAGFVANARNACRHGASSSGPATDALSEEAACAGAARMASSGLSVASRVATARGAHARCKALGAARSGVGLSAKELECSSARTQKSHGPRRRRAELGRGAAMTSRSCGGALQYRGGQACTRTASYCKPADRSRTQRNKKTPQQPAPTRRVVGPRGADLRVAHLRPR
jgi:hypothetical protein